MDKKPVIKSMRFSGQGKRKIKSDNKSKMLHVFFCVCVAAAFVRFGGRLMALRKVKTNRKGIYIYSTTLCYTLMKRKEIRECREQ